MADNKYNFWFEICDILVQNMVHFLSQLDKRFTTKYMQFIALGNIVNLIFQLQNIYTYWVLVNFWNLSIDQDSVGVKFVIFLILLVFYIYMVVFAMSDHSDVMLRLCALCILILFVMEIKCWKPFISISLLIFNIKICRAQII